MAGGKARTIKITVQDSAGPDRDLCFTVTRSGVPDELYGNWDIAVEYPSIDGRATDLFEMRDYLRLNGTTALAAHLLKWWSDLVSNVQPIDVERGLSVRSPKKSEHREAVITRARAAVVVSSDGYAGEDGA